MAGAIGVKCFAQGNNSSRKVPAGNQTRAPSLEPHDYQADALVTALLLPSTFSSADKATAVLAETPSFPVRPNQGAVWHKKHHCFKDKIPHCLASCLYPQYAAKVRDLLLSPSDRPLIMKLSRLS